MNQALTSALEVPYNRNEQARKRFVSSLRKHVLTTMADNLRQRYDEQVAPRLRSELGAEPEDGETVHKAMRKDKAFKFFSAVRTSAQEMVFASVIPGVERNLDTLLTKSARLANGVPGGSLTLNEDVEIPANVNGIDVHLAPGSYHSEYREEDITAGVVYDNAIRVFAFQQMGKDLDDIGATMANYIRLKYPQFKPESILDCGCTTGNNTLPWARTFPDAKVHAIDVAPGILRFAHARTRSRGVPVHFEQMDATAMRWPDASFDVVYSSMFLHELPLKDIKAFFREAYRVLKPGGLLLNMELPPNQSMGAYESFYLDWDSFYNNEPYYKTFRDQDYRALCTDAGFARDNFLQATLPRYTFIGEEAFKAELDQPAAFDSRTGRMDPKGTRWYAFGAWKTPPAQEVTA